MNDTDRPVALITMTGDYVGPALAPVLAGSGHNLVLHAPQPELVDALEAQGAEVEVVARADPRTAGGNQAVVRVAYERFGRLDAASFITGQVVLGTFLEAEVSGLGAGEGYEPGHSVSRLAGNYPSDGRGRGADRL